MAVTLGIGRSSLQAQRQLSRVSEDLGRTYERLSTGQRINRASDDAAGISIADRLKSDGRLYSVALRNVNDGLSLLNIASGALSEQTSIVTRLFEIAEQSANGTFSSGQRSALNKEYQQLSREYERITATTSFNGLSPLVGSTPRSAANISIQGGINGGSNSQLRLTIDGYGRLTGFVSISNDIADADGDPLRDGAVDSGDFTAASALLFGGSNGLSRAEVEALGNGQALEMTTADGTEGYFVVVGGGSTFGAIGAFLAKNQSGTYDTVATATYTVASNGSLTAASDSVGRVSDYVDVSGLRVFNENGTVYSRDNTDGAVTLTPTGSTWSELGDVTSVVRSRAALDILQLKLESLSQQQSKLGAFQSRLSSTMNTLASGRDGALSAESRIRDADIAREGAELVRKQILQQSAAQVLAQANQSGSLALVLLRA